MFLSDISSSLEDGDFGVGLSLRQSLVDGDFLMRRDPLRTHWGSLLNPLVDGDFGVAVELGQPLTDGDFWGRQDGCQILRCGQDGMIDNVEILGVADLDADQIVCEPKYLPPGTVWHFVVADVSHCGLESQASPYAVVEVDPAGEEYGAAPNAPIQLRAEVVAGGRIRLTWRYDRRDELVSPASFSVYAANSGSPFDAAAIGSVTAYGPKYYEYTTDVLTHGVRYRFGVRSVASTGAESRNVDTVEAIPDDTGPAAITGLRATTTEM